MSKNCSCNVSNNTIILLLCIAIFCRLGGCGNKDKDCIEQRLERIEEILLTEIKQTEETIASPNISEQSEYPW